MWVVRDRERIDFSYVFKDTSQKRQAIHPPVFSFDPTAWHIWCTDPFKRLLDDRRASFCYTATEGCGVNGIPR